MPPPDSQDEAAGWQRLDKFLFHARFVRTRSRAGRLISDGCVRVNRQPIEKPHAKLHPGDVLTLVLPAGVQVVRVVGLGVRRGPAAEARRLYEVIEEK